MVGGERKGERYEGEREREREKEGRGERLRKRERERDRQRQRLYKVHMYITSRYGIAQSSGHSRMPH